jgi:zona occludens toxin
MATAIHHGSPGSFKSFSVVQRHSIPALFEGRVVVTNVRGFDSLDTIRNAFSKQSFIDRLLDKPRLIFPDSAKLYYFDTSTHDQRLFFATWYKWLPKGALLIIDEAQTIYPDRADFKLEHLDKVPLPKQDSLPFPLDDFTTEIAEGRPHDIRTAFDKQRHYNWDIFLTTTNISKIKSDIRQSSEWAYRHRSLSEVSRFFKGQWYEHQHDTENNGKSESHRQGAPKRYKADKRVFNCYRSTATGDHIASQAGTSLFGDGAIKFKLAVVFIALFIFAYNLYGFFHKKTPSDFTTPTSNQSISSSIVNPPQNINPVGNAVATVKTAVSTTPVLSSTWRVSSVLINKKTQKTAIYIINATGLYRRVPPQDCILDAYQQPTCKVDNETVTLFSGLPDKPQHIALESSFNK